MRTLICMLLCTSAGVSATAASFVLNGRAKEMRINAPPLNCSQPCLQEVEPYPTVQLAPGPGLPPVSSFIYVFTGIKGQ